MFTNTSLRFLVQSIAFAITLALQIPTVTSIVHISEQHEHIEKCDNPSEIHVHEDTIHCDHFKVFQNVFFKYAFAKADADILPSTLVKPTSHTQRYSNRFIELQNNKGPPLI